MSNTVSLSLGCVMLRVKNERAAIEAEPFEETRSFAPIIYEIVDIADARQAPGTPVQGVQRLNRLQQSPDRRRADDLPSQ
jgi:hypothetical protein